MNVKNRFNIVFAINNSYADKLYVTLLSILENNKNNPISFYIISQDLEDKKQKEFLFLEYCYKNCHINFVSPFTNVFKDLKLNISYITKETYYRYIIADLLPNEDKALWLDSDLVVNGRLDKLYNLDLKDYFCAGAEDLFIKNLDYKKEIGFNDNDLYVNAGVLLLNLHKIRELNLCTQLINKTRELSNKIKYQDQDIINIVFKNHVKQFDSIYNFASANVSKEKEKRKKAIIIHYTGSLKPWDKKCKNKLKKIWLKYALKATCIKNKKIKVGLIIDEFFGGAGTAFGGYGFLARKYICKYIPDKNIQIDVLLGRGKNLSAQKYHVDDVDLYRLPKPKFLAKKWLNRQNYDIYLSIELVDNFVLQMESNKKKKLILWIQDPRPWYSWRNSIDTMTTVKEPCFYNQEIYMTVNKWYKEKRVKFISQGNSLNPLAKDLYCLPNETPIQYLPNPIEIDFNYEFNINTKTKNIIFLGRLETQKRAWLFCEIAKRMPEYNFYVLGQFFRYPEENHKMLDEYMNGSIQNLHFVGHVDGKEKKDLIKNARILLSTAIWEGIPISWLECLSYGTLLVSDLERENLVSKFGKYVGEISGDGFDGIDKFLPAIKELMENDILYAEKANAAIKYIRETHNIENFKRDLREVIVRECI